MKIMNLTETNLIEDVKHQKIEQKRIFNRNDEKLFSFITIILIILMTISSISGLIFQDILYRDLNTYYLANIIPQDIANLVIILPIFILSLKLIKQEKIIGLFLWMGCEITLCYIGITYCFTIPFNHLFLVYIAIFGISFYALIWVLLILDYNQIENLHNEEKNTKYVVNFLVIVFIAMYGLWLSDAIPQSILGELPKNAIDIGFPTSPFHIIDLALLFPGFLISALLLSKKKAIGYFLAPSYLALLSIFGFILEILSIYLMIMGIGLIEDIIIFGLIPLISIIVFIKFLKVYETTTKK